jgi:chromosome segregation ATPase
MSDKNAGQVLTSENAAEFYANRLGLAESPSEPVAEETSEPVAEETQSEPEEAEAEAKQEGERKQNPKLERRFSEITKQREEARKEAQAEREARQALEARLAALEKQQQPQQVVADAEPQPSQFSDAFEYAKALAEYTADKRLAERDRQLAEAKEAEKRQEVIQTWAKKVESAKAELPDFDDIVASSDVVVNDDIRDAILESDVGPKILYHLAENEDIAKKIAGMNPKAALREIGKLEARFEAKPEAEKSTPIVKSKAPAPIQPLRGSSGVADVPMSTNGEWHGSFAAWKEARKAGKIR